MSRNRSRRQPEGPQRTAVPRDPGSERVKIVYVDPVQPEFARQQVRQLLNDLEGTLFQFGGKAQITVERQVIGHVQLGDREEPLAETVAYILRFQTASPLSRPADTQPAPSPRSERAAAPAPPDPAVITPDEQEAPAFSFGEGSGEDDGSPVDPISGEELLDLSQLTGEQIRELGLSAAEIEEALAAAGS